MMMKTEAYKVVLEKMPSGLVVVSDSSLPSLHLSAPSMDAMLKALPRVIEHLFKDLMDKTVEVQPVKLPRTRFRRVYYKNRAARRAAKEIVVWDALKHSQIAKLAVAA